MDAIFITERSPFRFPAYLQVAEEKRPEKSRADHPLQLRRGKLV
jgi:hypothetical protein